MARKRFCLHANYFASPMQVNAVGDRPRIREELLIQFMEVMALRAEVRSNVLYCSKAPKKTQKSEHLRHTEFGDWCQLTLLLEG